MGSTILALWGVAILGGIAPQGIAADRPGQPQLALVGQYMRGCLPHFGTPEIVEMIQAVAGGSGLGPGQGWFHAGQGRYGWKWLAARHGIPPSGRISRREFRGPADLFDRLDRDGDGVLTRADFDWSDRSPFLRQQGLARQVFRQFDTDSNGRISQREWQAFFARAAKDKDHLTADDLRAALFPPSPPPSGADGPSPVVLCVGLLEGELGSVWEGPKVGQPAPDFALPRQDGRGRFHLSGLRGRKPVVLVFGSFT